MYNEIAILREGVRGEFTKMKGAEVFLNLKGQNITNVSPDEMIGFLTITCTHIYESSNKGI